MVYLGKHERNHYSATFDFVLAYLRRCFGNHPKDNARRGYDGDDLKAELAANGVDLVVSGHTHGGQLFPLKQLGEWFHLGGNDWVYGLTERGNTKFVITSGISDWALIFKTDCKSEFAVIDIRGAER